MKQYIKEFNEWFNNNDGQIIQPSKGVYSTQDAQFQNRLSKDELYTYFVREFMND